MKATAIAHPNIALIKYWGKRHAGLNLPATGSYSLTLAPISTKTTVEWGQGNDTLTLNGEATSGRPLARITSFLDILRLQHPQLGGARVASANDFPTAAGLASSASAFAALALASVRAANLDFNSRELSVLARRGSGSAARSIFGGFVRMHPGQKDNGSDAFAEARYDADHWDLHVLFALTARGEKDISSTVGMNTTADTSPYFKAWCESVPPTLDAMDQAVGARDFERVAELAEASALQMHASAIAAVPGVLYWNPATVAIIHGVRTLRERGLPVFFTIDAGPHVKVFVKGDYARQAANALKRIPGVLDVFETRAGGPARVIQGNTL